VPGSTDACCIVDRTMSLADVQMFVDEALTMTKFDHKHVLNIVGISFDANSFPMVVLPFMLHGDLLSYIRDEHNVSLCFRINRNSRKMHRYLLSS